MKRGGEKTCIHDFSHFHPGFDLSIPVLIHAKNSDSAGLQKSGCENPKELWRGDNRGHCQSGPRVSVSETVRWVSHSISSFI